MTAWAVRGVELPFGEEIASWWIDAAGSSHDLDAPGMAPGRRRRLREGLARVTELLPLAVRLGVRHPMTCGVSEFGHWS
jgi:hypothetical protein